MNGRKLLVVPVVACLALTLVLAVMVFTASVKSEPSPPYLPVPTINCYDQSNMTRNQIDVCLAKAQAAWAQYQQTLKAAELQSGYFVQFNIYTSYISNNLTLWWATTGTLMLSLFALAVWFPRSRSVRAAAAVALVCGSAVFAFWAGVDYHGPLRFRIDYPAWLPLYNLLSDHPQYADGWAYSAFTSFCVAVAGFVALRVRKSAVRAVVEGVTLYAAPALVAFEFGIWYYLPRFFPQQVTSFTPSWMTNSAVFVIALCLFIMGCSPFLAKKELQREDRLLSRMRVGS